MYLIQQLEDTDICNSSLQISDSYALPKTIHLLFFWKAELEYTGMKCQEVIFLVFSKKEFPKRALHKWNDSFIDILHPLVKLFQVWGMN